MDALSRRSLFPRRARKRDAGRDRERANVEPVIVAGDLFGNGIAETLRLGQLLNLLGSCFQGISADADPLPVVGYSCW